MKVPCFSNAPLLICDLFISPQFWRGELGHQWRWLRNKGWRKRIWHFSTKLKVLWKYIMQWEVLPKKTVTSTVELIYNQHQWLEARQNSHGEIITFLDKQHIADLYLCIFTRVDNRLRFMYIANIQGTKSF